MYLKIIVNETNYEEHGLIENNQKATQQFDLFNCV